MILSILNLSSLVTIADSGAVVFVVFVAFPLFGSVTFTPSIGGNTGIGVIGLGFLTLSLLGQDILNHILQQLHTLLNHFHRLGLLY